MNADERGLEETSAHRHQAVAPLPVVSNVGDGGLEGVFGGRVGDEGGGFAAGDLEDFGVAEDVGETQRGQARLFRAEELAGAAELEVHFRDVEAVRRFDEGADAFPGGVVHLFGDQDAVALRRAAADAAAKLVELGETETLGLLDEHQGGVAYVHADFDDRGGHEDLDRALLKLLHGRFLLVGGEAAVHEADGDVREDLAREVLVHLLRGLHGLCLGFLDDGVDDVGLAALVDLLLHEAVGLLNAVGGVVLGLDRLPAGRELVDYGDVEVTVEGHGEGAGDRGGGHDEDVGGDALLDEAEALEDAKAVLLVNDGEAELVKADVLFEDGMGADHDVDEALGDQF